MQGKGHTFPHTEPRDCRGSAVPAIFMADTFVRMQCIYDNFGEQQVTSDLISSPVPSAPPPHCNSNRRFARDSFSENTTK